MKPLGIIPNYATAASDLVLLEDCLKSLRASVDQRIDILVVDDFSPDGDLRLQTEVVASRHGAGFHAQHENGGFSRAVNVGLRQALDEGRDAILINADIEIQRKTPAWLEAMQTDPAAVVGGLLLYPDGELIQHAGIYFSLLSREFDHLWKYAPHNLPVAQERRICPVTAALQYIKHWTLEEVGLYDESFPLGWEDVDYCIRVFQAGLECAYNPKVRAWHHESIFRGRPDKRLRERQTRSLMRLMDKYRDQSFAGLVPFL